MQIRGKHVSTISNLKIAENNSGAVFWNVNVNTAGSGAILKVYNDIAAVSANLIAQIDCGSLGSYWYGIYCPNGIFYDLSVASADVTIGYA